MNDDRASKKRPAGESLTDSMDFPYNDSLQREFLDLVNTGINGGVLSCYYEPNYSLYYISESLVALMGYDSYEELAAAVDGSWLNCVAPEDRAAAVRTVTEQLADGGRQTHLEYRIVTRTGKYIWVHDNGRLVDAADGRAIIIGLCIDICDHHDTEQRLRIREEEYHIALQHSNKVVFRFDMTSHTLFLIRAPETYPNLPAVVENVPHSIIEWGWVADESVADFRDFFAAMHRGEPQGSCVVLFINKTDGWTWFQGQYTMVYDAEQRPSHAIISCEDVSALREKELAFEKWRQTYEALPDASISYYEYNLTRDTFDREEGGMLPRVPRTVERTLSAIALFTAENYAFPDDRPNFLDFYSRERLLNCYESNIRSDNMEFRRLGAQGEPLWTLASVQLIPDPYSNDIKGFILLQDIDAAKREEILLNTRSREDPLTGLLNRDTFMDKVTSLFKQSDASSQHALVMIDLDGFKQVNDTLGHFFGDKVLVEIAHDLRTMLRAGDFVGRIGGDEFVLCLKDIPIYNDVLGKRAQFICQLLSKQYENDVAISASLGIALYPSHGLNFNELYQKADVALYKAKQLGKNRFVFYNEELADDGLVTNELTPIDDVDGFSILNERQQQRMEEILEQNNLLLQRQSEDERYRIIMEQSNPVIFEWNLETGNFFSSPGFKDYALGQISSDALFRREGLAKTVHPDDFALLNAGVKRIVAGEPRSEITARLRRAAGGYVWCRITAICIANAAGRLKRIIGMISEIDFVQETESIQLQALMTYMAGGVMLAEIGPNKLRTLYTSPNFYAAAGLGPEEAALLNQNLLVRVYEEDRAMADATLRAGAVSGELIDFAYRAYNGDGNLGWYNIRAIRIPYEASDNPVLIGVVTDISETKNVSIQLQSLVDNLPGGVAIYEWAGGRLQSRFVNQGLLQMLRCTPEEYEEIVRPDAGSVILPEDRRGLQQEINDSLRENRPLEYIYRATNFVDDAIRWMLVRAVVIETTPEGNPVFIAAMIDITPQKLLEQELALSGERTSLALTQTDATIVWEFDLATRLFRIWDPVLQAYDEERTFADADTFLMSRNIVHPDSMAELNVLLQGILSGAAEGSCVVYMRQSASTYCWSRISYRMLYDEKGEAFKAVGIFKELPNIMDARQRFLQEEQLRRALEGQLIGTTRINLTQNKVESLGSLLDRRFIGGERITTYDEMYEFGLSFLFGPEDEIIYRSKLAPEAVIASYERGNSWIVAEYRRIDEQGNIQWVSNTINLITEPVSGDLYAFGYMRDVDRRKKWELALDKRVERDVTTYLYTADTTRALITNILAGERNLSSLCALVLFDLIGLSQINETMGLNVGNKVLFSVCRLFRTLLDDKYIIGSISDDRIAVFLTEVPSAEWVEEKAKDIISTVQALREASHMREQLTFVAGVAVSNINEASYSGLYDRAAGAIRKNAEAHTLDRCAVFSDDRPFSNKSLPEPRLTPSYDTAPAATRQLLLDFGDDSISLTTMLTCIYNMLAANNLNAAINGALREIAEYCQASRAFIAQLDGSGEYLEIKFEWTDSAIRIQNGTSRRFAVDMFPDVRQAREDMRPIIVEDTRAQKEHAPREYQHMLEYGVTGYYLVPFITAEGEWSMIGVDNPRQQDGDIAMIISLAPFIKSEIERRRLQERQEYLSLHDAMTGVFDRNGYMETLRHLRAGSLSSLGVAAVDINGLKHINQQYGNDYGDEVVRLVARGLRSHFEADEVFRVSGDEFQILSCDRDYESFVQRTQLAWQHINKERPGCVAIGFTWADRDISPEKMVARAQEKMLLEKQESYTRSEQDAGS